MNIIGFYNNKIYKTLVSRVFTLGFILRSLVALGFDIYYLSVEVREIKEA